ncbi:hypothetical protein [Ideonella paludis]|uniref:hypothetical protein n=1 Tax=Ideonella paludis TaxID=1233411 RepID=UPI0036365841
MSSSHAHRASRSQTRTRADPLPPPPLMGPQPIPSYIGKYQVLRKLGEGATSDVFLAYDEFHGREVALKRARPTAGRPANEAHFASRFLPPRQPWSAACTTRMWCRSWTPLTTRWRLTW